MKDQIKAFIKANFSKSVYNALQRLSYRLRPVKWRFTEIYRHSAFGGKESVSGPGSDLMQTETIREEMPKLVEELNIKSLLDAPCGDFYWMQKINFIGLDKYIGADIVPEIIADNNKKYANKNRQFITIDIIKDRMPSVDMIICRDCFVHFSFKHIFQAIKNFENSKSKYFLATTFPRCLKNNNIITGEWRPINLQLPPFNFPAPIKLIDEKCSEQNYKYSDKKLGLWKFEDINFK